MQTVLRSTLKALGLTVLSFALGCGEETAAPSESGAISLSIVSGEGQSGVVGIELPQPLVVKATNSKGQVVAGVTVNFRVTSGGGSVFAGSTSTDSKGTAADYWTLGTSNATAQRVEVRAVEPNGQKDVYGVFTANALPASATTIVRNAGDNQSAAVGTSLPIPPSVKVTDTYGNSIAGVAVAFAVAAGGGAVTGGSQITNGSGVATVGAWTMGSATCDNSLTATAVGLTGSPIKFTATAPGNCWTTLAPMPTPRYALRMAAVDGILYAVGGISTSGVVATVDAYDPLTNTWTTKAPMSTVRGSNAIAVVNGILYAISGGDCCGIVATVVAYDPSSDTWSSKAPIPFARAEPAAGVANGEIYVIGGVNIGCCSFVSAVDSYNPITNVWTSNNLHAYMPTARYALAVGGIGNTLYAVGGEGYSGVTGALEAYDAVADSWTTLASMPTPRLALGVGVSGGLLYAVGGGPAGGGAGPAYGVLEVYDPTTNSWSSRPSMQTPRFSMGVSMLNGILYTVGGRANGVTLGTVEAYRP